ncbi:phenylacetic acid degradation protein [Arthrobacter sp. TPD3018]|uniref:PaaI family thioesterase n=1 Tax=Bacteria TaxID=2 RepID=UPI000D5161E1|nr:MULTISPECIES: PaaI family thioesterase [Bacteria]PVE53547.1 phenylacetic acid degradation protein [Sphingomonas sp. TPD3009]PVE56017.1 phenylacetic acid degradation protein [Arthrobacter sp. TPD3018]PVE81614.1 phenylacetic acid degradation protein [Sphingomonas melonis]
MSGFNLEAFMAHRFGGHGGAVGITYHGRGDDWVELALPYDARLIGDPGSGVIASGPIITLMDMATSVAVWIKRDKFAAQATLDLRVDYLRPAVPGRTVIGRGECLKLTRSIAFVRGIAYDETPDDPLAHVAGTFMLMDQMA